MKNLRVTKGVERSRAFEIEVDGEKITAYEGETVATALVAAGKVTTQQTPKKNEPRGVYCGIGLCYGCIMVIEGVPNTKACQTQVKPGLRVETQKGLQR
jgi:predicted molibdopterin-dependent oxidoreductase YjgC